MISGARPLRLMWSLATLASIVGVLLGVMAVVTSLSMAVPIFTGQRMRDEMMVAFVGLPVLQVALVILATVREDARPRMAIKLYGLAIAVLAVLAAIPALPLIG